MSIYHAVSMDELLGDEDGPFVVQSNSGGTLVGREPREGDELATGDDSDERHSPPALAWFLRVLGRYP